MTNQQTQDQQRRSRWRSYFEQTLLGKDYEVEAATDAAMEAVARGQGQAAIIAAGRAAAKRERLRREGPRASAPNAQANPPPAAHAHRPTWHSPETGRAATTPPPPSNAAPRSGPSTATRRPARIWPPNSAVVSMLEKRSESMDGQFFQTWSFRLLQLEDGHRPVQPPIPVEIRGRSIIGQLAKGDVVELPYGRPGQTRIVKTLRNLSTECMVEAKGRPFRRARTLRRTFHFMVKVTGGIMVLALFGAGVFAALHYTVLAH